MQIRHSGIAALLLAISLPLSARAQAITMGKTVPFEDASLIKKAVIDECGLPEKHAELLKKAADAEHVTLVQDDEAFKAGKGRILMVQIVSTGGGGNAWTGRSNSVAVKGKLTENGTDIGNFTAVRSSSGGAFGGYKGACSIFGRDVQTLSADIAKWLKNPTKDAKLGELK